MAFSPKSLSRCFQSHTLYYYVSAMCILFVWVAVSSFDGVCETTGTLIRSDGVVSR